MIKSIESDALKYYKTFYAPKGLEYINLILNNKDHSNSFVKNRGASTVIFDNQDDEFRGKDLYEAVVAKPDAYKELLNTWFKTELGEENVKPTFIDTTNDTQSLYNIFSNTKLINELGKYTNSCASIIENPTLLDDICNLDTTNTVIKNVINNTKAYALFAGETSATKLAVKAKELNPEDYVSSTDLIADTSTLNSILADDTANVPLLGNINYLTALNTNNTYLNLIAKDTKHNDLFNQTLGSNPENWDTIMTNTYRPYLNIPNLIKANDISFFDKYYQEKTISYVKDHTTSYSTGGVFNVLNNQNELITVERSNSNVITLKHYNNNSTTVKYSTTFTQAGNFASSVSGDLNLFLAPDGNILIIVMTSQNNDLASCTVYCYKNNGATPVSIGSISVGYAGGYSISKNGYIASVRVYSSVRYTYVYKYNPNTVHIDTVISKTEAYNNSYRCFTCGSVSVDDKEYFLCMGGSNGSDMTDWNLYLYSIQVNNQTDAVSTRDSRIITGATSNKWYTVNRYMNVIPLQASKPLFIICYTAYENSSYKRHITLLEYKDSDYILKDIKVCDVTTYSTDISNYNMCMGSTSFQLNEQEYLIILSANTFSLGNRADSTPFDAYKYNIKENTMDVYNSTVTSTVLHNPNNYTPSYARAYFIYNNSNKCIPYISYASYQSDYFREHLTQLI